MPQMPIKNNPGPRIAGDGFQDTSTVDPNGAQWVRIDSSALPSGGGGPIVFVSAPNNPELAALTQNFTMLENELRDIRKLLALILINAGGELPSELDSVFEDDVAA